MTSPTFYATGRVRKTELSRQKCFRSECGRWKLIEVRSLVGLGRYWLAVRCYPAGECVVGRRRKRPEAEQLIRYLLCR